MLSGVDIAWPIENVFWIPISPNVKGVRSSYMVLEVRGGFDINFGTEGSALHVIQSYLVNKVLDL